MIRVQIIDDNYEASKVLATYLNQDDEIQVINISTDGKKGKDNYLRLRPDVLLLDLQLPSMNGAEILDCLSKVADDKEPDDNVIAISDYFYKYRFGYAGKLHSCIPKPFDACEIKNRIKEIYAKQQLSAFNTYIADCRKKCREILTSLNLKLSNESTIILMEAVILLIESQKTIFTLKEDIYPVLGPKLNISPKRVQWNLDRAMRIFSSNCSINTIYKVFPNCKDSSITLKPLICLIANKLDPEHSYSEASHCVQ